MSTTETDTEVPVIEETAEVDTTEVEERAGKVISQKNLDQLQSLHDSLSTALDGLRDLMDVAKGGGPVDSEMGTWRDEEQNSLSLLSAQVELRKRVAAAEAA